MASTLFRSRSSPELNPPLTPDRYAAIESVPLDHGVRPPRMHLTRPAADPGHIRCGGGVSGRTRSQPKAGRADGVDSGSMVLSTPETAVVGPRDLARLFDPASFGQLISVAPGREERAKPPPRRERTDLCSRVSGGSRLRQEHVAVAGLVGGVLRIGGEDEVA